MEGNQKKVEQLQQQSRWDIYKKKDVVKMSAQARIPPEMADAPPYAECTLDNGATLAEDAQYDAILASYHQTLDPSDDAWGARCLVKIMRELPPGASWVQEIARNCILLVLALFSSCGNHTGMPGTDIHELPDCEQSNVLEILEDLKPF